MSEQLDHQPVEDRKWIPGIVFTDEHQAHDLATDIQHIGAAALLSEANAAIMTGQNIKITVPNPSTELRGRTKRKSLSNTLTDADEALRHLQVNLESHSHQSTEALDLHEVDPNSLGIQSLREMEGHISRETILEEADISPFIRVSKDLTARAHGRDPEDLSWTDWFKLANEEQLINFSQWYTQRLRTLSDPDDRGRFIKSLKADFQDRINNAIQDGWIDIEQRPKILRRLKKANIRFFSPFGHMVDEGVGIAQSTRFSQSILLPSLTSTKTTVHELGHAAFPGSTQLSVRRYFKKHLTKDQYSESKDSIERLNVILKEGAIDHMAIVLADGGKPTIVSPSKRRANGLSEDYGDSNYEPLREIFATIIGGEDGVVSRSDVKKISSAMSSRDFSDFARYIDRKWQGRDVLTEVIRVINQWSTGELKNHELLAEEVITALNRKPEPNEVEEVSLAA